MLATACMHARTHRQHQQKKTSSFATHSQMGRQAPAAAEAIATAGSSNSNIETHARCSYHMTESGWLHNRNESALAEQHAGGHRSAPICVYTHTHTLSLCTDTFTQRGVCVSDYVCVCVYNAGLDVDGWIGVEQAYRGCRFSLSPFVCVYCMIVLLCCRCALRLTHTMCSDALSISLSGNCHLKTW